MSSGNGSMVDAFVILVLEKREKIDKLKERTNYIREIKMRTSMKFSWDTNFRSMRSKRSETRKGEIDTTFATSRDAFIWYEMIFYQIIIWHMIGHTFAYGIFTHLTLSQNDNYKCFFGLSYCTFIYYD